MRPPSAPLGFVQPMLPSLVDAPPEGADWIHEIKYDGWRCQIVIENGAARVFTRNGHDWTAKFHPIAAAAEALCDGSAIIDGEIVALDEAGKPDIDLLRVAMRNEPWRLLFVSFDLLWWNNRDLRRRDLIERRRQLVHLVEPAPGRIIQFSEHVDTPGAEFYAAVDAMGLEGMVSKRADSTYASGRTRDWLKAKCFQQSEYEVVGILREPGTPAMVLMADHERRYVGSAFIGLNKAMRERLWQRVTDARTAPVIGLTKPATEWIRPGLIGRVKHLRGEEKLRHAVLQELGTAKEKRDA